MERESKFYIPVVHDQENGSWAYRGAAGKKETLENLESLRNQGIQLKDVDIIPVIESRKDKILRAASIIGAIIGIIDFGTMAWKYYKKKKNGVRKGTKAVQNKL